MEAAAEWLFTVDGNVTDYMHLLKEEKKEEVPVIGAPAHTKYSLKAVIIHLGKSVHSGHYVAYIRT